MKNQLHQLFAEILTELGAANAEIHFSFPENETHGDYTTNIAMVVAKRLSSSPREIAQKIVDSVKTYQTTSQLPWLERVDVAGPGFINIYLSTVYFGSIISEVLEQGKGFGIAPKGNNGQGESSRDGQMGQAQNDQKTVEANVPKKDVKIVDKKGINTHIAVDTAGKVDKNGRIALSGNSSTSSKTIMVEFAHPNTHKAFHIGHLRNITTGEAIVRLLESQGNHVIRANYQGDVGMHIAKALYALTELSPFKEDVDKTVGVKARVEFLGKAYASGSAAFEESDEVKKRIGDINKQIYAKEQPVYDVYTKTRQWSLDYFDTIYKRVDTHYDRFYFESETYESGKKNVLEGLEKGIFEKSQGAIIFPGEKYGLHNRVFISGEGNATYEGKDMGLAPLQHAEFHPDLILHVLGPEQFGYTRVMFKALDLLFPNDAGKQFHLTYGWVKLKEGKMSSRTGNVILGEWLIDEVKKAVKDIIVSNTTKQIDIDIEEASEALAIGAIKYAFLKVSTNQEIAFDLKESINTNGDSGPYLMYCYARCKSVLRKAGIATAERGLAMTMNSEERAVARMLMQFPEIVTMAADNYAPNTLCTYLFQLAQTFNSFYANNPIMENTQRLAITAATAQVLQNGLYLLGIKVLERM